MRPLAERFAQERGTARGARTEAGLFGLALRDEQRRVQFRLFYELREAEKIQVTGSGAFVTAWNGAMWAAGQVNRSMPGASVGDAECEPPDGGVGGEAGSDEKRRIKGWFQWSTEL